MRLIISKFGGTSMGTAKAIEQVAAIIQKNTDRKIVVVSAMSKVTNKLVAIGELAKSGKDWTALFLELKKRHDDVIRDLNIELDLSPYYHDLQSFLKGITIIKELSPRSRDYILSFGERLSSEILATLLTKRGVATRIDTREIIKTDNTFCAANLLRDKTRAAIAKKLAPLLTQAGTIVVTGFIGANENGDYTTFTRGGSDYTAAILADLLDAQLLEIWTDVDGIMDADPHIITDAKTIPHLGYKEAAELSYFGAKVLHPQTIEPAVRKNIPVKVLNTFNYKNSGTTISADTNKNVKSITIKKEVIIIAIYSTAMLEAKGILAKIFSTFEKHNVAVDVVSTSEVSVSVTIDCIPTDQLLSELRGFADIEVSDKKTIICLVGEGINEIIGLPAKLFSATAGYTVSMISQGASPRSITLVVNEADEKIIMKNIYNQFFN